MPVTPAPNDGLHVGKRHDRNKTVDIEHARLEGAAHADPQRLRRCACRGKAAEGDDEREQVAGQEPKLPGKLFAEKDRAFLVEGIDAARLHQAAQDRPRPWARCPLRAPPPRGPAPGPWPGTR